MFSGVFLRSLAQEEISVPDTSINANIVPETAQKKDSVRQNKQIFESPINYDAKDSIIVTFEDGQQVVQLYKGGTIKYGTIELAADFISVNLGTKEIFAKGMPDSTGTIVGKPHFKEGSEEFDCSSLRYNFVTSKGFVENVITEQEGGKVHGGKAKMVTKDIFCMVDGKYSTCDAEHPHFYLHINKGKMINKKALIAGLSYIVVEDFPLFFPFLPYGYIPTNKTTYSSGVIIPSYGELTDRGFYLKDGGFYWAASDYFDIKLTGDIYSKGSWAVNFTSKYKVRYKASGNLGISYSNVITGEKGINQRVSPAFKVIWSHSQDQKSNPSFKFSANVDFSTNGFDQLNEYENTEKYLNNSKSSSVSIRKDFLNTPFSMSANMRIAQSTKDSMLSISLPDLTFNMRSIQPFKKKKRVGKKMPWEDIAFSYSMTAKNYVSLKEYDLFTTPLAKWKKGVSHNLPITLPSFKLFDYINITPSVNYSARWFFDYLEKYWVDGYVVRDNETGSNKWVKGRVVEVRKDGFKWNYEYSAGIGASTTIYGIYQMTNPKSKIVAVRHKMDPTISMSYRPDFGQSKFGFYKWVQVDSLGNMNQYNIFEGGVYSSTSKGESGSISFGLNNNIEMKVLNEKDTISKEKYKKIPIFDNLSFNGSYNLAADSFNLSPISLNARTKIAGTVLNINGTLDPYALDAKGNRTSKYMWSTANGISKLGRMTNISTGFGFAFSSSDLEKKIKEKKSKEENTQSGQQQSPEEDLNSSNSKFSMPWRVNINYSFNYSNPKGKPIVSQSIGLSGSIDFTDKWKATFNSGFDFRAMKMTYTSMTVTRNLHCWTMSFNFCPIGVSKFYTFSLSANASMLKDLKVEKRSTDFPDF